MMGSIEAIDLAKSLSESMADFVFFWKKAIDEAVEDGIEEGDSLIRFLSLQALGSFRTKQLDGYLTRFMDINEQAFKTIERDRLSDVIQSVYYAPVTYRNETYTSFSEASVSAATELAAYLELVPYGTPEAISETERLGACWKELRQVLGMFDVRDLNNLSTSVRKELQQARCRAMEDISASANHYASGDVTKSVDTRLKRDRETLQKLLPQVSKLQQYILATVWDQKDAVPFRVLRKNWKGNTRDPDSETIIRAITRTNEKLNEILDNLDIELEFGTNRDSVRIVFACEKPRK